MATLQVAGQAYNPQLRLPLLQGWKLSRGYRVWQMQPRGRLGPYYIDWRPSGGIFGEGWSTSPHDAAGVLVTSQRDYHPVCIAQYALHEHARYLQGRDDGARQAFLAQARWLRDAARRAETKGTYAVPSSTSRDGKVRYFASARAQSEAISVLLRAHECEAQEGFLEAALLAAEPFKKDIREGGVVWRNKWGDTFLEEVAALPAAHVLGSGLIGFWGIFELQRFLPVGWIGEVLGSTIATLQRRLEHYDSGYWSYESALTEQGGFRFVASLKKHDFHIAALRVCASMTGDAYFDATADAWSRHVADAHSRLRVVTNLCLGTARQLAGVNAATQGLRTVF